MPLAFYKTFISSDKTSAKVISRKLEHRRFLGEYSFIEESILS